MNQPLVSLVIPVYNTGRPAKKLLQIIQKQSYQNLDVVVVDDGSTDDSLSILQELAATDSRLRIFHQNNSGQSSARNLGISKAQGDYIIFLDSDDLIEPTFIQKLVAAVDCNAFEPDAKPEELASREIRHKPLLAVTGFEYRRLHQNTKKAVFTDPALARNTNDTDKSYILRLLLKDGRLYSSVNKIFRTKIIKDNHILFDTTLNFAEDTKFVLEYLKYAYHDIKRPKSPRTARKTAENYSNDDIIFILEPLYIYNFGTETSTIKSSGLKWQNWQSSYNDLKKWLGRSPSRQEARLLKKIRLRWRISHALAVARAPIGTHEQLQYLDPLSLLAAKILVKFRP